MNHLVEVPGEVKVDTIILTFQKYKLPKHPVDVIVYKGFERINEISENNCSESIIAEQSEWKNDENKIFRKINVK